MRPMGVRVGEWVGGWVDDAPSPALCTAQSSSPGWHHSWENLFSMARLLSTSSPRERDTPQRDLPLASLGTSGVPAQTRSWLSASPRLASVLQKSVDQMDGNSKIIETYLFSTRTHSCHTRDWLAWFGTPFVQQPGTLNLSLSRQVLPSQVPQQPT